MTDDATPTPFAVLDFDRSTARTETGRHICEVLPQMKAYVLEVGNWVTMPVRLAYSATAGFVLEVGPYDLDDDAVRALRHAIAAWDDATAQANDEHLGTRVFDWPAQDEDR